MILVTVKNMENSKHVIQLMTVTIDFCKEDLCNCSSSSYSLTHDILIFAVLLTFLVFNLVF